MVKPHSPIAECKKPSHRPQGPNTPPICVVGRPKSVNISPRKVASEAQIGTRVTFHRKVTVKHILHITDISQKVRDRYWMTAEEHSEIKNCCRKTIMKMMSERKRDESDIDFCPRGLETRTKEGQKEKNQRKDAVKRAVLLQQRLQKEEGAVDPQFLAVVSQTETKGSAEAARFAALKDAEEAWLYLHEELRAP